MKRIVTLCILMGTFSMQAPKYVIGKQERKFLGINEKSLGKACANIEECLLYCDLLKECMTRSTTSPREQKQKDIEIATYEYHIKHLHGWGLFKKYYDPRNKQ